MRMSREQSFAPEKLWCGSVQEARRLGMKDTCKAKFGTVCILPLVSRGRVLATFGVVKYQENAFTGDVEFLTQIANQVAIAVENALALGRFEGLKISSPKRSCIWKMKSARK